MAGNGGDYETPAGNVDCVSQGGGGCKVTKTIGGRTRLTLSSQDVASPASRRTPFGSPASSPRTRVRSRPHTPDPGSNQAEAGRHNQATPLAPGPHRLSRHVAGGGCCHSLLLRSWALASARPPHMASHATTHRSRRARPTGRG